MARDFQSAASWEDDFGGWQAEGKANVSPEPLIVNKKVYCAKRRRRGTRLTDICGRFVRTELKVIILSIRVYLLIKSLQCDVMKHRRGRNPPNI